MASVPSEIQRESASGVRVVQRTAKPLHPRLGAAQAGGGVPIRIGRADTRSSPRPMGFGAALSRGTQITPWRGGAERGGLSLQDGAAFHKSGRKRPSDMTLKR